MDGFKAPPSRQPHRLLPVVAGGAPIHIRECVFSAACDGSAGRPLMRYEGSPMPPGLDGRVGPLKRPLRIIGWNPMSLAAPLRLASRSRGSWSTRWWPAGAHPYQYLPIRAAHRWWPAGAHPSEYLLPDHRHSQDYYDMPFHYQGTVLTKRRELRGAAGGNGDGDPAGHVLRRRPPSRTRTTTACSLTRASTQHLAVSRQLHQQRDSP